MSDPSGSGFGKFVPGFEFLQNLAGQAAGGVAQGLGKSLPQMPNLGNWVAPTFNVEDLEKRIEELKAVHFWLDQNAKALGATIQALEVQKMTLATLQTMNFSLGDVANALKLKASDSVASFTGMKPGAAPAHTTFAGLEVPPRTYGTATGEDDAEADGDDVGDGPVPPPDDKARKKPAARKPAHHMAAAAMPAGGVVDPMHWWGALSQQFQTIAANAMKDVAKQTSLDTTRHVASGLTEQAVKTATGMAGKVTRGLTDTVARNVGTAAGMGKAAARAVTSRRPAAAPAAKPASRKKTVPRRSPAAHAPAVQALPTGDWPLPTAFFQVPGFPLTQPAAKKRPAPKKAAARKAAAKKSPARKSASRKTAAKKTASTRSRR